MCTIGKLLNNTLLLNLTSESGFLASLDATKNYVVEIKEKKSEKTIQQNKMFWKACDMIAKHLNQDLIKTYCDLLERANAQSAIIQVANYVPVETLRKKFRSAMFVTTVIINNEIHYIYKVYLGVSDYDTKEMADLIEIEKDMLSELGIYGEFLEGE